MVCPVCADPLLFFWGCDLSKTAATMQLLTSDSYLMYLSSWDRLKHLCVTAVEVILLLTRIYINNLWQWLILQYRAIYHLSWWQNIPYSRFKSGQPPGFRRYSDFHLYVFLRAFSSVTSKRIYCRRFGKGKASHLCVHSCGPTRFSYVWKLYQLYHNLSHMSILKKPFTILNIFSLVLALQL